MQSRVPLSGLAVVVLALGILAAWPGKSQAIPAFARKYQTSCQTCHVAFPQLTPFGEAFRRNGYRFPSGTDPDVSKQKDIPLGSEGYKKVFPKAVWPGSLPSEVPLAAIMQTELLDSPHTKPHMQFDTFGNLFEILAAGTLGETISFFNEVPIEFEDGDFHVGVERAFAIIKPTTLPTVMFRVGRFETGMANVSEHRGLVGDYWMLTRGAGVRADSGAANDFSMEPAQQGFEVTGTPGGRFAYTAGLVEGTAGVPNDAKDFYGRAEYKLGGLRLDGVESGEASAMSSPQPWLEKSLTLGAFAYSGKTLLSDAAQEPEDKFYYAGGDLYANAANFLVRAGYAREHHDAPFEVARDTKANVDHVFVEAQHIYYPWLFPVVRYEMFSSKVAPSGAAELSRRDSRITPGIVMLVRANVETIIKADVEKIGDEKWLVQQVGASLALVF